MKILRNPNNEVIGICKTQTIYLNEYGYFKIYGIDLEKPVGICNPSDIDEVKCKCGGSFKIVKIEKTNYELLLELILECENCKGNYVAIAERKLGGS